MPSRNVVGIICPLGLNRVPPAPVLTQVLKGKTTVLPVLPMTAALLWICEKISALQILVVIKNSEILILLTNHCKIRIKASDVYINFYDGVKARLHALHCITHVPWN